ncbi:hypothetical protein [Paenibacillus sp. GCM10012306]|uniref:hypothetical protein n=1 Tax=Paenibacillus sp. GCM10012306 TaxID=3317342 RepID=UPI003612BBD5
MTLSSIAAKSINQIDSTKVFMSYNSSSPSEITLYYAAVITDENPIITEYIFTTLQDATASGHAYRIATWEDINSLATYSDYHLQGTIINTPQGRFIWHEEYEEDITGEMILSDCMYRAYGAPEAFSKRVEEYLNVNYNEGAKLLNMSCGNHNGQTIYTAILSSAAEGTFSINSLGMIEYY